jgi:MinD superfamily P-loop ATPase
LVCINKADLNSGHTTAIEAYCAEQEIEVVGKLPFDTVVTEAMIQGRPVTEFQPEGAVAAALRQSWTRIQARLEG